MTNDHKPVPPKPVEHKAPAKSPMAKKAEPKPAPRAPIPSMTFKRDDASDKGRIAAAVGVTLAAGALIGRSLFGVASKVLGRGR